MLKSIELSSNRMKAVAIAAMFFDHLATIFLVVDSPAFVVLKSFGRIVMPTMCFFVASGYHHTSNLKKYLGRLFVFAVISHFPFVLALGFGVFQATSVMWPLFLGLGALVVVKAPDVHPIIKLGAVGLACLLAVPADWNFVAVMWIVVFGVYHGNFKRQMIGFCLVGVFLLFGPIVFRHFEHGFNIQWFQLAIFLAVPFLASYNGRQGKKSRWFARLFYVFYPVHLLLLYFVRILLA